MYNSEWISPCISILCAEILGQMQRNNTNCKSVNINNTEVLSVNTLKIHRYFGWIIERCLIEYLTILFLTILKTLIKRLNLF